MDKHLFKKAENAFAKEHSELSDFSLHLKKWTDENLPDMYDNNAFEYFDGISGEELLKALKFQREKGDTFLKLEGDFPLPADLVSKFGLTAYTTLTMALPADFKPSWTINTSLIVKDSKQCVFYKDYLDLELYNYGSIYGEDFCRRKIHKEWEMSEEKPEFHIIGGFFDNQLVSACHIFEYENTVCLDGLQTKPFYRNNHFATTLIKYINDNFPGILFLHADAEDTPKDMYSKMGFKTLNTIFEYLLKCE